MLEQEPSLEMHEEGESDSAERGAERIFESIEKLPLLYRQVAESDPLNASGTLFRELPAFNLELMEKWNAETKQLPDEERQKLITFIQDASEKYLFTEDQLEALRVRNEKNEPGARVEALAALRDVSYLIGSAGRFGVSNIYEAFPELAKQAIALGKMTGEMPYGSGWSHTDWNSSGPDQRLFTYFEGKQGKQYEADFNDSVRLGMSELYQSISSLESAREALIQGNGNIEIPLAQAAGALAPMFDAINQARPKELPEDVFNSYISPFFSTVKLEEDGEDIRGPSAAHLPILLVDMLIGTFDDLPADMREEFDNYRKSNLKWSPPELREAADFLGTAGESIISIIKKEPNSISTEGLKQLISVLDMLTKFRAVHLGVVRTHSNTSIRQSEKEIEEEGAEIGSKVPKVKGSGGYSLELLQQMLSATNAARKEAEEMLESKRSETDAEKIN
jgi:hypothetical protein